MSFRQIYPGMKNMVTFVINIRNLKSLTFAGNGVSFCAPNAPWRMVSRKKALRFAKKRTSREL